MRKKPPDKYYPPLRYYLALVIVCTVLMYCKQIKGEQGGKFAPPDFEGFEGIKQNYLSLKIIFAPSDFQTFLRPSKLSRV